MEKAKQQDAPSSVVIKFSQPLSDCESNSNQTLNDSFDNTVETHTVSVFGPDTDNDEFARIHNAAAEQMDRIKFAKEQFDTDFKMGSGTIMDNSDDRMTEDQSIRKEGANPS